MNISALFLINLTPGEWSMNVIPLSVVITINVALVFVIYYLTKEWKMTSPWHDILNYVMVLGIAWLTFSILYGLLLTFDMLEGSKNMTLFQGFSAGFKIAMVLVLFGLLMVTVSLVLVKALKSKKQSIHLFM